MILYVIAFIVFCILLRRARRSGHYNICSSSQCLNGKTAIVTGGTIGIGLEIAKDFAKRGAKVIIACPFEEEGKYAEKFIIEETGNQQIQFRLLDLGSFKSVREFASQILKTEKRIDILVNNAGVSVLKDFVTEDGLNVIMQINYYGHFLLTLLLLPLLKKTGTPSEPAKILNNASIMHRYTRVRYLGLNIGGHNYIERNFIYGTSKLCLILFSRELTKRCDVNIVANTADPGLVGTRIYYTINFVIGFIFQTLLTQFSKNPLEGAQTAIHVAIHDKEARGKYFKDRKVCVLSEQAQDDQLAAKVWEESVKLVKLSKVELEDCLKVK